MATFNDFAEYHDNALQFADLQRLREVYREYAKHQAEEAEIERLKQQLTQRERMLNDLLFDKMQARVIGITTVEVTTKRRLALDGLPE